MSSLHHTILAFLLISCGTFSQTDNKAFEIDSTHVILLTHENNIIFWAEKLNHIYFAQRDDTLTPFKFDSLDVSEYISYERVDSEKVSIIAWSQPKMNTAPSQRFVTTYHRDPNTGRIESRTTRCNVNVNRRISPGSSPVYHISKNGPSKINKHLNVIVNENQLTLITPEVDEFVILNDQGELVKKGDIRIAKPKFYSFQGREMVEDIETKDLYFITATNFNFLIHKLDFDTGKTDLVYKFDGLWPDPEWEIKNGVLEYSKKETKHSINLIASN